MIASRRWAAYRARQEAAYLQQAQHYQHDLPCQAVRSFATETVNCWHFVVRSMKCLLRYAIPSTR